MVNLAQSAIQFSFDGFGVLMSRFWQQVKKYHTSFFAFTALLLIGANALGEPTKAAPKDKSAVEQFNMEKAEAQQTNQDDKKSAASEEGPELKPLESLPHASSVRTFKGACTVSAMAVSPDSKTIAIGGTEQTVQLWDLATGKLTKTLPPQKALKYLGSDDVNYIMALAFSPNGKVLAVGFNDGSFGFWDMDTFEFSRDGIQHRGCLLSLAFSPDGRWLVSSANSMGEDSGKIWDMKTGELYYGISALESISLAAVFSPDSQWVCASTGQRVALVNIATKETQLLTDTEKDKMFAVRSLAFSPDSKTLAVGTTTNKIRVWDVKTKTQIATWEGIRKKEELTFVDSLAFSKNGEVLGLCNGNLELLSVHTGQVVLTLADNLLNGLLVFTPDGKSLIVGDRNKRLTAWSID